MCFRSIRQNTDSQAFHYSYFSGLKDRTQCYLLMNWAKAKVLVVLTEGKGVKLHLPGPFHSPRPVAMGVLLGMLAGAKGSRAGGNPHPWLQKQHGWTCTRENLGKGGEEHQGLAQKDSHSTAGSLHPRDELLNDAVLFF